MATQQITDDALATDWTLSESDITTVWHCCRGAEHALRFALQLCTLRNTGRFLTDYRTIPLKVANYLTQQLETDPVLFVPEPVREATEYRYQRKICGYLNYRLFGDAEQAQLTGWVRAQVADEFVPQTDLLKPAEAFLRSQRIVLPTAAQLGRFLATATHDAQQQLYQQIVEPLTDAQRQALDEMIATGGEQRYSALAEFKRSPVEPSAAQLSRLIRRYQELQQLGLNELDFRAFNPQTILHLSRLAKCYTAWALRRITPAEKRYALMACFLFETSKTLLDHIVDMNAKCLTTVERKARNRFEDKYRKLRRHAQRGLSMAVETLESLLNQTQPEQTTVAEFLAGFGKETVQQAVANCKALKIFTQRGLVSEIDSQYGNLRKYTPRFFLLEFDAAPGSEALLQAIELLRELNDGRRKCLPERTPVRFLRAPWRHAIYDDNGSLSRRRWELGLYFAAKQALDSGDLYLRGSRRHRHFWDMMYNPLAWRENKAAAYRELQLPSQFDAVLLRLRNEFDESAALARRNLGKDGFATITPEGRLKLCKDDKLLLPASTVQLREQLGTQIPLVRIEKLLAGVDQLCGFSEHFQPLPGLAARMTIPGTHLRAALTAHGTNVGLFEMGHSNETVTVDQMRHATKWLIRDQTLNAANAELIATHRGYPITTVWGDGLRSSSDGQRFGIQKRSLLGSFYPRYFGYYDRAITVYTHISDQYSVFNTLVISCSTREATYVLDGLLNNISDIQPEFHSTDTAGYTDHIFALCYLLGFSFQPRLADIPHQRLCKIDKDNRYGDLDVLFSGAADIALIREQWDQLVRVAASLKNGIAPAHIILERLAGRAPSDKVAKALAALGRIVKSAYLLRYVSDPALRYDVQLQLNRGESRHQLAKHLFFLNHGIFKTNDLDQIMNKATCLSLLSNAVLVWNTHHIARTVSVLRRQGHPVDDLDLARISPLGFKNILVHGTYDFSDTSVSL